MTSAPSSAESEDRPRRRSFPARLFLPDSPRTFAGQRACKIALRAVHVLCAGLLVAAHLFAEPAGVLDTWRGATALSGTALLAFDLAETGAFLFQVRGWFVAVKVGVLAALPALGADAAWLLVPTFLGAVVMSHAPSRVRYFIPLGRGRVRGAETKG